MKKVRQPKQTPKFRSNYIRVEKGIFEKNDGSSATVPDQSFTIRQLFDRYSMGMLPNIGRDPIYDDEENFDNYDRTNDPDFDLADATERLQQLSENLRLNKELQNNKKAQTNAPETLLKSEATQQTGKTEGVNDDVGGLND